MSTFIKDPDANLDYKVDWSSWLPDGDTIASAQWIVPDELTAGQQTNDDTSATVWLSGGTARQRVQVTCRITTTQGRVDDRSFTLIVRDR